MTIKLYVGDIGSDLAQQARANSTSAWLINSENYTTFLNLSKIRRPLITIFFNDYCII